MRQTFHAIMMTLVISALFYVPGAVSNASFYLDQWGEDSRDVVAIFWALAEFAGLIVVFFGERIARNS